MFEISRGNASYFAGSLLGRGLIRLLARDPLKLAQQAVQSKQHATNFGKWSIGKSGPGSVEIVIRDEYTWIETAMLGAATGTFSTAVKGSRCEVELVDRFNGSIVVRW
jgi:uncharacterized protein (TIGR02265 family)